jgi:hypothetical protein
MMSSPVARGRTREAGQGLDDDELKRQVAGQTSSDRKVAGIFERERNHAASDTEAAKSDPADLGG